MKNKDLKYSQDFKCELCDKESTLGVPVDMSLSLFICDAECPECEEVGCLTPITENN